MNKRGMYRCGVYAQAIHVVYEGQVHSMDGARRLAKQPQVAPSTPTNHAVHIHCATAASCSLHRSDLHATRGVKDQYHTEP